MQKLDRSTIKQHLNAADVISAIEVEFVKYSAGSVTVPPVGHLPFPGGDCHIKYGYIDGDENFVIKIASGSHNNTALGISPDSGMMVICSATTGHPVALLEDEGHLTDVRTADFAESLSSCGFDAKVAESPDELASNAKRNWSNWAK